MELTGDSLSEGEHIREEFEEDEIMPYSSNKAQAQYGLNTVIEKCEITTFHKTEKALGNFTSYEVCVIFDTDGDKDTFNMQRRYSEFLWLHKNLAQIPGIMLPPFPEKDYFNQFTENLIQYRKVLLHNYLSTVSKKEPALTYTYLMPFLSYSSEELELHIKNNPVITEYLPTKNKSYSFFSWLKVSTPKMKIDGLKKYLSKISVPQEVPKIDEDELDKCAVAAKTYGNDLAVFANNLCSMVDKNEDLTDKLQEFNTKVESINGVLDDSSAFSDDEEPKKKLSSFEAAMLSLNNISKQHVKLFVDLREAEEKLQSDIENYGYEFTEISRLSRQYKKYLSNISEANMLTSEYQSKLLTESDLGMKKKHEELVRQLKEFKELMGKCLKIFRVNFSIAYKQFKMTRIDAFDKLVESYLEMVKGIFFSAEESFGTTEE